MQTGMLAASMQATISRATVGGSASIHDEAGVHEDSGPVDLPHALHDVAAGVVLLVGLEQRGGVGGLDAHEDGEEVGFSHEPEEFVVLRRSRLASVLNSKAVLDRRATSGGPGGRASAPCGCRSGCRPRRRRGRGSPGPAGRPAAGSVPPVMTTSAQVRSSSRSSSVLRLTRRMSQEFGSSAATVISPSGAAG